MPEDPEKPDAKGGKPPPPREDGSGSPGDGENERPTVNPPFDPVAFAKEVLGDSPPQGTPAIRLPPLPRPSLPVPMPPPPKAPTIGGAGPKGALPPPPKLPARTDPEGRVPAPKAPLPRPPTKPADGHPKAEKPRATTPPQAGGKEGSRKTTAPPPRKSVPPKGAPPVRRATPKGALSLINQRIPSNLPPPPKRSSRAVGGGRSRPSSAPPRGKGATDLPTRPPPDDNGVGVAEEASKAANEAPTSPRRARPEGPSSSAAPPMTEKEMNDRVSLGDYSGALTIAEHLIAIDPKNLNAAAAAETCRTVLRQMYTARIGPLDRVPTVMVSRDQLRWLSIDHRAGFVLSLVDGVSSIEMILDVSGMTELDALRILSELAQQRIIAFR